MTGEILTIRDLTVTVGKKKDAPRILSDVDFSVGDRKIVGLVGGSGSGKTTAAYAVLRLLNPALRQSSGEAVFRGKDLMRLSENQIRSVRGGQISMIAQEPLEAFNPIMTVGDQIDEVLRIHCHQRPPARRKRIRELLEMVELPEPDRVAKSYPHQLSGGMRQRAMIAQGIAADPRLLIADEPTSNLDVTLQARIMDLFRRLRDELHLSILLITHDLGMVGHLCDDVVVMYKGKVVEKGAVADVTDNPQHEYTAHLMRVMK